VGRGASDKNRLVRGHFGALIRFLDAAFILALPALVAWEVVKIAPGAVAAVILFGAAVIFTVDLGLLRLAVTKEGFSLEPAIADAEAAKAGSPPEEPPEPGSEAGAESADLSDLARLRLKLEAKLSYIAGSMSLETGAVMIGSLHHDGYLNIREAATADRLMRMTDAEFALAPREERDAFLKAAGGLVKNIRASVLAGATEKRLESLGWSFEPIAGKKRDLLATSAGRTVRVLPVFAVSGGGNLSATVAQRVGDEQAEGEDRRLVVLPNESEAPTSPDANPAIVKLDDLAGALEAPR